MNFTAPSNPRGLARILRSPLGWLAVGIVIVGAFSSLASLGPVRALVGAALALASYLMIMRFVARRSTPELAIRGAGRDVLVGVSIGAAFLLASIAGITLLGGYRFTTHGATGVSALPELIALAIAGALTEELLFRGLAFQAIEQLGGTRTALVVTAALFGLIHLANPGATLWSSLAIAIEAGGLLGAAFIWRRSLWLVTALHATWNGLEQLFGIPVSGHVDSSLLLTTTNGPSILTGGDFGLEASIVPVIISAVLTIMLLRAVRNRGASFGRTGHPVVR